MFFSRKNVFPSGDGKVECSHFTDCAFQRGLTTVRSDYVCYFDSCHFQDGAILRMKTPDSIVHFEGCVFQEGSVVKLGNSCEGVRFIRCTFPTGRYVIKGKVTSYMHVLRSSPSDTIPTIRDCQSMHLSGGLDEGVDWEIRALFDIPRRMNVDYVNLAKLVEPCTLDSLVKMMLYYPRFKIADINWKGPKDEKYRELEKVRMHPCRGIAAILVTLLRVLPGDLVRDELTALLIG